MFNNKKKTKDEETTFLDFGITLEDGISTSKHSLKGGDRSPYFVDFDLISTKPSNCKKIANQFKMQIDAISKAKQKSPDVLVFIEKDNIGTVGTLTYAAHLSIITGIPMIIDRHWKELIGDRIKLSKDYNANKLKEKNIILISDVSTTGTELWDAICDIKHNGGNVTDIIVYYSRLTIDTVNEFATKGISIHPLYTPHQARYVSIHEDVPKIKSAFNSIDETLKKNGKLIGDSAILQKIVNLARKQKPAFNV